MARGGRKYRLVIYEYMLNRWWPMTLLTALALALNVGVLWGAQWYYINPAENPLPNLDDNGGTVLLAIGGICLLFTFLLLLMRKRAYVQLFDDHLRLATPFMRLDLSYKRIVNTSTAQVFNLFPPKSLSSWNRDLIGPISGRTVMVLHLNSYPLSRFMLRMFLSPFFFYDKTKHFVLILDDWMGFSTELDSRRVSARMARQQQPQTPLTPKPPAPPKRQIRSGLLDDLKRK